MHISGNCRAQLRAIFLHWGVLAIETAAQRLRRFQARSWSVLFELCNVDADPTLTAVVYPLCRGTGETHTDRLRPRKNTAAQPHSWQTHVDCLGLRTAALAAPPLHSHPHPHSHSLSIR